MAEAMPSIGSVKVVRIVFAQYLQLIALRKSFLLVWYPAWRTRQTHAMQAYLRTVMDNTSYGVIFVLVVDGGRAEEGYAVDVLLARDLPLLTGHLHGALAFSLLAAD